MVLLFCVALCRLIVAAMTSEREKTVREELDAQKTLPVSRSISLLICASVADAEDAMYLKIVIFFRRKSGLEGVLNPEGFLKVVVAG